MSHDYCCLQIRVWHGDSITVAKAFHEEPSETVDLTEYAGLLRLLIFAETQPDLLSALVEQGIAFDGSFSNGFEYPGQIFASIDGVFRAIDQPYGVVTIPIDLATLQIDQEALADLRAYRELAEQVERHFRAITRSGDPSRRIGTPQEVK